MARSTKLQALRSASKVATEKATEGKQQLASADVASGKGRILPDLNNPPKDTPTVVISAQTQESRATYYARMAVAPKLPEGMDAAQWVATLTPQQRAALTFESDVRTDLDKAEDVQRSPLMWHFDLVDIYTVPVASLSKVDADGLTVDANGNVCLLDKFPIPDTETGNNPAKKKEPGRKKDGTPGMVPVDFYDVMARNMSEGIRLLSDIESLLAANPKSGNATKVKPEHVGRSEEWRQAAYATAKKRWQRFRTTIKDAMWIRVQWAAIAALPLCEIDWVYDLTWNNKGEVTSKEITSQTDVFCIWPKGQKANLCKSYSVSNFLKLDPAKAAANGGTFAALEASVARGTPGAAGGPAASNLPVLTVATFEPAIAEVARFFRDKTQEAALLAKAMKPEGNAEALSDDYVLSLGDAALGVDVIFKHIQARYQKLDKSRNDKAQQEKQRLIAQAAGQ